MDRNEILGAAWCGQFHSNESAIPVSCQTFKVCWERDLGRSLLFNVTQNPENIFLLYIEICNPYGGATRAQRALLLLEWVISRWFWHRATCSLSACRRAIGGDRHHICEWVQVASCMKVHNFEYQFPKIMDKDQINSSQSQLRPTKDYKHWYLYLIPMWMKHFFGVPLFINHKANPFSST